MNITDIRTSIRQMPHEEALELVKERRKSRFIPKKSSKGKGSKIKEPLTFDEVVEGMHSGQMKELKEKLEKKVKKDGET